MEMEPGKLFIGGISWDTNEYRLREYFQTFGEVVEAVIMKDRTTGRARGFGFVVFSEPAVAERVVMEKHIINGKTVEAKKAVPRDDQNILNKNNGSIQCSPGPARTKKIFVGGLASTVTVSNFKTYFDQFGIITDVVVMYDHNTQRPRGFGFITYDSEKAVDKVLIKTFHELNGKMVEVKRAVPKELSPGPTRSLVGGYNIGLNRVSSFLNAYAQGYHPNLVGDYGSRMDGQFSPVAVSRSGYPSYISSSYGLGPNTEPGLTTNYGGSGNFSPIPGYGRFLRPSYGGSSNRHDGTVGYSTGAGVIGSPVTSGNHNMWGNRGVNYATNAANSDFIGSRSRSNFGSIGPVGFSAPNLGQTGGVSSAYSGNNMAYINTENNFRAIGGVHGKNSGCHVTPTSSCTVTNGLQDGVFKDFFGGGSFFGDATWRSSSSELDGSFSFGYGRANAASDFTAKNSIGYVAGYSVNNSSNKGIAA